jgi:hypothetical protein
VDLPDSVLERVTLYIFSDFAILDLSLKGYELSLLKRFGEARSVSEYSIPTY